MSYHRSTWHEDDEVEATALADRLYEEACEREVTRLYAAAGKSVADAILSTHDLAPETIQALSRVFEDAR
jgi:hypothetical protein